MSLEMSFGEYFESGSKCETLHHGQARFRFDSIIRSLNIQRYADRTCLRRESNPHNLESIAPRTGLHFQNRRASRAMIKRISRAWFMENQVALASHLLTQFFNWGISCTRGSHVSTGRSDKLNTQSRRSEAQLQVIPSAHPQLTCVRMRV